MQTPPLQPVDGIILVLSCQHNIASRIRQFPTHSHYNGWKVIYVVGNLLQAEPFMYEPDSAKYNNQTSVLTLQCEDSYIHLLKKLVLAIEAVRSVFVVKDGILRANDTLDYNQERLSKFLSSEKPDFYGYNSNFVTVYCASIEVMKNVSDDLFMVNYYNTHPQDFENPLHNLKGVNIGNYTKRPHVEGVWGKLVYLSNHACDVLVEHVKKINYNIFAFDELTQSYPYTIEDCAISFILYLNNIPLHHSSTFIRRHPVKLDDVVAIGYDIRTLH